MLEPGKTKPRRALKCPRKICWSRIFYYFFAIVFNAAVIYVLFFSLLLSVKTIRVTGTEKIKEEDVRSVVSQEFLGKYLNLIPRNNLIFTIGGKITNDLESSFHLIENADVKRRFPDTLEISITERQIRVILCGGAGDCYLVDEKGNLFPKSAFSQEEFNENDYPVLNDTSGKSIDFANDSLSPDSMDFMTSARTELKNRLNIDLEREMETPSRVSSDIRFLTKEGWKIFFNENIDLDKEIGMLEIVLNEKIQGQRSNLEYVDLRADNKVFYKFKGDSIEQQDNQNQDQSSSSSSSSSESKKKDKKDKK